MVTEPTLVECAAYGCHARVAYKIPGMTSIGWCAMHGPNGRTGLCNEIDQLREALGICVNHAALIAGPEHATAGRYDGWQDALERMGAGAQYEAWCIWERARKTLGMPS